MVTKLCFLGIVKQLELPLRLVQLICLFTTLLAWKLTHCTQNKTALCKTFIDSELIFVVQFVSACVDRVNPRTAVSDCPQVAYLCNNSVYFTLMTEQCPRTCNRCPETVNTTLPPSDCKLKSNNIACFKIVHVYRKLCGTEPNLYRVLIIMFTVEFISACVDRVNPRTGVSDCPKRAYLCNNPVYFNLMTEQCPSTCNRCPKTKNTTSPSSE
ncbi:unnamed protein product [Angiostrongylus costaricensis]|uniref:ShKT domain-containing protein n=1 Tax=Angiostrongylus costaricensis TaxID=334426 RepID=A0A0R3PHK2_ANGCS|nr:unnamed protein product [Angiostrongylus costaricensis]